VAALARNVARQQPRVRLFELGKVFAANGGGSPLETQRIAAAAYGDALPPQWSEAARALDFHDLKGDLESLAALSGAELAFLPSKVTWGHPGRSADVHRVDGESNGAVGRRIGWIGELHPRLQRALDLDHPVIAFEVDLAPLQDKALPSARGLSKFPSVRRDLAFVVADGVAWAELAATVRKAAGPTLSDLRLFDRYVGKGVEKGFKSLAMGLILQDDSRTLTDRDVDAVVAAIVAALRGDHGAEIRQ
jgi:phenylalanyl-tRNA synthetase beta chain